MLKFLSVICLLLALSSNLKAQKSAGNAVNPFGKMNFSAGPVDTLTLMASYAGDFGKLSENNISIIQSINAVHNLNIKRLHYSFAFKIDGCPQLFYMPSMDNELFNTLSSKQTVNRLKLKCTVYRFYTLDGVTNFFYVTKASVQSKSI